MISSTPPKPVGVEATVFNQRRARNSQGIEINLTVVTQHHIAEITNTSMNHIHTRATKNDIGALVNEDQIVATMLRSDRFDEVDD